MDRNEKIANCKTLEELKELAEELNYKPNWANHVWQARLDKEARDADK